jgi:predicted nucleotidyltransferase
MPQYSWANCPADVRAQLDSLVTEIRAVLGDGLVSVCLHGSMAAACFNPACSDLDILVLQQRALSPSEKRRLADTLLALSCAPAPIEISFVRIQDLKPWRYPTPYDFHFGESHRERIRHDLETGRWKSWGTRLSLDEDLAAHITIAIQRGISLYGPPIPEVLPAIPERDYRSSILADFAWTTKHVQESPLYAVLSMCRVLAYVSEGRICSKQEAGEWASHRLPDAHVPVVRAALEAYSRDGQLEAVNRAALQAFASYMENEVRAA